MRLVADNRPAPPQPGYRESLSRGICQRCRRTGPVRTVGMRRPEVLEWTQLALCQRCICAGIDLGYPMLS
jgi:hypothetical protein